ncbi:cellulase family glycosylhydrolase [Paenarthrobacter sp. OM7]|uniref:glycoside hydrolase 5 family protein n=1 Tax=Paenarthrobacter sp. OM7 TaxID=3041264 RepID=UPI0024691403|nr:cellulase family glycosylhydrolase [Paenarthrobacter sp. OM7]WGM20304.1 cellulase family glycosylhydrolase [Paenarthrobacter sp. OM7]
MTRFGVNYVPSKNWWHSWVEWNEAEITEDLQAIADLGCDHVRIHCLWTLFQPDPRAVSRTMLTRLEQLLDIAENEGLDVIVTVLNGWLSGFDFRPAWIPEKASIFGDQEVVAAEKLLFTAIAERVGAHPRFLGFDVANEPSVLITETKNVTSRTEADAWARDILSHCEEVAPGKFHTIGMDHVPWLSERAFSRDVLAETGSATPLHAWIFFTGALERYGEFGTGTLHLTEYMLELAKAYSPEPTRQVWLQEFGIANQWAKDLEHDDFAEKAALSALSVDGLWGITWWCSHDIDRKLGAFVELEYDLGLFTTDNQLKPTGQRLKSVIESFKQGRLSGPAERTVAIVLPEGQTPGLDFADTFFALIDDGKKPAIVLEGNALNHDYLKVRGIETLVRVAE